LVQPLGKIVSIGPNRAVGHQNGPLGTIMNNSVPGTPGAWINAKDTDHSRV
jgi:hypothetical protein